jgi:energy-coupling factor transport system permease protein
MRIHELNFFAKLVLAFALMTVAWLVPDWRAGAVLSALSLSALWLLSVPNLTGYLKGASLLTVMVMASWILNLWLQGQSLLEAVPFSLGMSARLLTTTAAFFFVMETSSPGSILSACSAARLPPILTLILSLTFGIIPMLRDEFSRIGDAQRARGMEIDDVGLVTRLRFALARGVPLLVQAIRMAHAISFSLTLCGYDLRRKRTTWREVGLMVESRLTFNNPPSRNDKP